MERSRGLPQGSDVYAVNRKKEQQAVTRQVESAVLVDRATGPKA